MKIISLFALLLISFIFCEPKFKPEDELYACQKTPKEKKECGYISINQEKCESLGCCYYKNRNGGASCYKKEKKGGNNNLRRELFLEILG